MEELDELARLKLSSKPEEHDKTARLSKKRKSTSDWEELHEIERPSKKRMLKSYLEELDEAARQKKEEDLMARGAHHKKIVDILSWDKSIAEEKSHPDSTLSELTNISRLQEKPYKGMGG